MPRGIPALGPKSRRRARARALLLTGLLALSTTGCQAPPPGDPGTYAARVADGLIADAHAAWERRDLPAARDLVVQALEATRVARHLRVQARALRLQAMIENRAEPLAEAIALSEALRDEPALDLTRLAMAQIALHNDQPDVALEQVDLALAGIARWPDRQQRAGSQARAHHLGGRALFRLGRPDEAAAHFRQARLQLSLVADEQFLRLRQELAMGLGDAEAALGEPDSAFKRHAEASALARQLDDLLSEVEAVLALGRDCSALDRLEDAATQAERAVRLALDGGELPLAHRAADEARAALLALDLGPGTTRWDRIDAWLLQGVLDHDALDPYAPGGS